MGIESDANSAHSNALNHEIETILAEKELRVADVDSDEISYWHRWLDNTDMVARQYLIDIYLPYGRVVAATYYARRTHDEIEFAEYQQFASVGLMEAFGRFDPARGIQFKTFAARRMHGAILDGLESLTEKNRQIAVKRNLRQGRLRALKEAAGPNPVHVVQDKLLTQPDLFSYLAEIGIGLALGIMLDGTGMLDSADRSSDGATFAPSPEISYFRKSELLYLQRLVRELVVHLTSQEQTVIRYHYLQEISFTEIANMMGVTKGRVSQLHKQALLRLRDALAKERYCDVIW